jgi:hypothetical protein
MRYNLRNRKPQTVLVEKEKEKETVEKVKEVKELEFDVVKKVKEVKEVLEMDSVELEEVDRDGACLYECLARGLLYANPILTVTKNNVMNLAREYIYVHQNRMVDIYIDSEKNLRMTFGELVKLIHEMDIDTYYKRYKEMNRTNWGGLPEIIAISELFQIQISVYKQHLFEKKYILDFINPTEKHNYNGKIHLLLKNYHYSLILV